MMDEKREEMKCAVMTMMTMMSDDRDAMAMMMKPDPVISVLNP